MTSHTNSHREPEVIHFTKMHGLGNDYIYIDCREWLPDRIADLAREMSDRHFGVGGDGIVLICPSSSATVRMRMFNADGSEARMCGNASRCIARYVHDNIAPDINPIYLETQSGIKVLSLNMEGDSVDSVTVDMGRPEFSCSLVPVNSPLPRLVDFPVETPFGQTVEVTAVSMGNPHAVIFVDDLDAVDFDRLGPWMETHPLWPDKANVEFAQVISHSEIRMRVWERGTGETLACGTGACATAVAAALTGRTARRVRLMLRGGDLDIDWSVEDGHVHMTGPATKVFEGDYIRNH